MRSTLIKLLIAWLLFGIGILTGEHYALRRAMEPGYVTVINSSDQNIYFAITGADCLSCFELLPNGSFTLRAEYLPRENRAAQ